VFWMRYQALSSLPADLLRVFFSQIRCTQLVLAAVAKVWKLLVTSLVARCEEAEML